MSLFHRVVGGEARPPLAGARRSRSRRTGDATVKTRIVRSAIWLPLAATVVLLWPRRRQARRLPVQPSSRMRPHFAALANWAWLLVPGWAIGIFLIINYVLPGGLSASANIYIVQPILWLSLAAMAFLLARYVSQVELPFSGFLVAVAALAGVFHLSLLVLAGVMLGFGNSPYAHTPWMMAQNCLYVGSMLVGVELSRACVVAVVGKRSTFLALVSASLLFTFIAIPVAKFTTVGGLEDGTELAGGTLLPTTSENLLASFLALVGGPVASIAYRGVLEAFEWFSPILPDLRWTTAALVGTLAPAAALLIVRGLSAAEPVEEGEAEVGPAPSLAPWMIAAFAAVVLLWFNTGMLGVNPHVIAGHSMQPAFDLGDVVITRDVSPASIKKGDVIWFRQDGISIIHRVIEVRSERGETLFITQGDNNNTPDDLPVAASQVEGKVVVAIPKIGWVGIFVKNALSRLMGSTLAGLIGAGDIAWAGTSDAPFTVILTANGQVHTGSWEGSAASVEIHPETLNLKSNEETFEGTTEPEGTPTREATPTPKATAPPETTSASPGTPSSASPTPEVPKPSAVAGEALPVSAVVPPDSAPAPPTPPPPDVATVDYSVRPGESLSDVAAFFGTTVETIVALNGLANANLVVPGQVLLVPAPPASTAPGQAFMSEYVIQPGETLTDIAARFGTTVEALAAENNLANPSAIRVGDRLLVP